MIESKRIALQRMANTHPPATVESQPQPLTLSDGPVMHGDAQMASEESSRV